MTVFTTFRVAREESLRETDLWGAQSSEPQYRCEFVGGTALAIGGMTGHGSPFAAHRADAMRPACGTYRVLAGFSTATCRLVTRSPAALVGRSKSPWRQPSVAGSGSRSR